MPQRTRWNFELINPAHRATERRRELIDISKLRPQERHLVAGTDEQQALSRLVRKIRETAESIGYREPREYGDLSLFAKILESRGIKSLTGRPWYMPGHGSPRLERFIKRHCPELNFPLIRPTKGSAGGTNETA